MKELLDELFEEVKHGDQEHQDWLRNKFNQFYLNKMKAMFFKEVESQIPTKIVINKYGKTEMYNSDNQLIASQG